MSDSNSLRENLRRKLIPRAGIPVHVEIGTSPLMLRGDLGLLGGVTQVLKQLCASRRCQDRRSFHFRRDLHQQAVEVVAAEVGVAVGGEYLEHALGERED